MLIYIHILEENILPGQVLSAWNPEQIDGWMKGYWNGKTFSKKFSYEICNFTPNRPEKKIHSKASIDKIKEENQRIKSAGYGIVPLCPNCL